MCHKPISGRCACPQTTPCPCTPTTPCPCPETTTTTTTTQCPPETTTTTPCPCPRVTPCPQTFGQQNIQPFSLPCENCIPGELHTQMPVFLITAPPAMNYNIFGAPDVNHGPIIVTDGPPPPC